VKFSRLAVRSTEVLDVSHRSATLFGLMYLSSDLGFDAGSGARLSAGLFALADDFGFD
jgi:hypothetical protein